MASFNGNIATPANGFNLKVDYSYTQSSDGLVNNYSTISNITGYCKKNNSSYYPYNTSKTATIKIERLDDNNNWVTVTTLSDSSGYSFNGVSTSTYLTFVSGSNIKIPHKTDGTQQIRITFDVDGKLSSYYPVGSISNTATLTTIPRATASPNLDGYIESGANIILNPAVATFKHRLYYSYNGKTGYYPSETDFFGNVGYLPLDTSFYDYTPKQSGTGDVILYTFDENGNEIGSKTSTITIRCDKEKCKPIIEATVVDSNETTIALTGDNTKLIKGFSDAQIDYTITTRNNATLKSKTINGNILEASPHRILNVATGIFNILVIDSRDFDTTLSKTNEIVDYIPLTLDFNAYRPTPTGSEIRVNFQGNYFDSSFGKTDNTLELSWKYRIRGTTEWTDGGTFTKDTDYKINNNKFTSIGDVSLSDTLFNYQNNYEIAIFYADKLVDSGTTRTVTKGEPILSWEENLVSVNTDFNAKKGTGTFADIKCKNLLYTPYTENNKLIHTANYYDEYWHTGYRCYLEAGKTYTFSCETDTEWEAVEMFLLKDDAYELFYGMDNNPHTFTITETGYYYLRVDFNNQGQTYSYWNFQVEEGETKTEFAEAKEFSNKQHYLTAERVIGTWIDGKPLYRKVINFGVLPNASSKEVALNVSNIEKIISIKGCSMQYDISIPIPFPSTNLTSVIALYCNIVNGTVSITTGADRSSFTETYITIEYTKTTD